MTKTNDHLLSEMEVTLENIVKICKEGGINANINPDGGLRVQGEILVMLINIIPHLKLIRFFAFAEFKEDAPKEEKYRFVNDVNDKMIFTRFSISLKSEDRFLADYTLSYENGILEFQIIAALRLLEETTIGAVRAIDTFDIVQ